MCACGGGAEGEEATQVHLFIYFDSFPLLCALNENSFPFDVVRCCFCCFYFALSDIRRATQTHIHTHACMHAYVTQGDCALLRSRLLSLALALCFWVLLRDNEKV